MPPDLHLAVQYGTPSPELPRWRIRRWVERAVSCAVQDRLPDPVLKRLELTVRLVDADEGLELNHAYRNRDYATNVLTFAYGTDPDGTLSSDIVLCVPVLHREAEEQDKAMLHHAAHLIVHGVLHALGYDHEMPDDAERMENLETALLAKMGIPDPYQY